MTEPTAAPAAPVPSPPISGASCGNCAYFKGGLTHLKGNGFCLINPPSPQPDTGNAMPQARWPVVEPTNWCGSHKGAA